MRCAHIAVMHALVAALAVPSLAAEPPTLHSLRALHAAHRAELRTLQLEETVRRHKPRTAAEEARLLSHLQQRAATHRQRLQEQASQAGLSPPEQTLIVAQRMRDSGYADFASDTMPVWRANQEEWLSQRHAYDFTARRHRIDQRDLRDVPALMRELGVSEQQRPNLDQTRLMIVAPEYSLIGNCEAKALTVLQGSELGFEDRLLLCGIIPERLLSDACAIETSIADDGAIALRGQWVKTGMPAFECTLRAEPDHRMTRFARFNGDGEATHEIALTDYRSVGLTAWLPFRTHSTRRHGGDVGASIETRELVQVEINPALRPDAFDAPRGMRLQPLIPAAWEAYQARSR